MLGDPFIVLCITSRYSLPESDSIPLSRELLPINITISPASLKAVFVVNLASSNSPNAPIDGVGHMAVPLVSL